MHLFVTNLDVLFTAALAAGVVKPAWHFAGVFHPAVVHFPIALLTVAALMETIAIVRSRSVKSAAMSETALTCLLLGAAGAVVAATLGWANVSADGGGVKDDTTIISVHRWAGVTLAALALVTAIVAFRARRKPQATAPILLYRGGVMASAALVGLVGLYGGKITHGDDHYDLAFKTFLTELHGTQAEDSSHAVAATQPAEVPATQPSDANANAAPAPAHATASDATKPTSAVPVQARETFSTTAPTSAPSQTSSTTVATTPTDTTEPRVEYARDVKPIFDTACVRCHGAEKQKSGYRLDSAAAALNAGDSGVRPIVPGHAADSLLVKLVEAHGEFANKRMPTKGPPLTADQVAMIKRWIDDGAQ